MLNGDVLTAINRLEVGIQSWMGRMEAALGVKLDRANEAIDDTVRAQAREIEALGVTIARLEAELAQSKAHAPAGKPLSPRVMAALMKKGHLPHDVQRAMRQQAWAMAQEGVPDDKIIDRIEFGDADKVAPLMTEV